MFTTKRMSILMLILCLTLIVGACSSNNGNNQPSGTANTGSTEATPAPGKTEELKPVNLTWYYIGPEQEDLKSVQEAVNKITQEKINATVTLKIGSWNYQDKMNPIVASGEPVDIIWASSWNFNYVQNVKKGAFMELTEEQLAQYMPKTRETIPAFAWDGVKVDGKIYGVPSYQIMAQNPGFIVRKSIAEKYGLDPAAIKTIRDMEPFMAKVKAGEKDMVTLALDPRNGLFKNLSRTWGLEEVGGVGAIDYKAGDYKVMNIYETAGFKESTEIVRDWYQKGYIHKDAPLDSIKEIQEKSQDAIVIHTTLKPGGNVKAFTTEDKVGEDSVYVPLVENYVPATAAQATLNAVSKTSANPERAMMFLELVNNDKELYNLISNGIKDKHYKQVDDKYIEIIPESGYSPNTSWVFGNTFNEYLKAGMLPTIHEETLKMNAESKPAALMGYVFNPEPVQSNVANVTSVLDTYLPILLTGAEDPAKVLPEFQQKLKQAGVDEVIAELQKQIDEWKSTKK
ncbi:ABC transporter substrate-binding protein [Paenibacillus sp. GCM10023252]|uniref:ABC transporter substrate-binding protein n=1 Tax=Paenibacillus sp. GCM10023252 TaxID=3252649 RepID=UPI00360DCDA9